MPNSATVASLFQPPPDQWRVRGDPYLWDEIAQYFVDTPLPKTKQQLAALLESAFQRFTGTPVTAEIEGVFVERYDLGGLSSGLVSPGFWRTTAIPLLKSRLVLSPPETRDYFAELYVAGIFGDAGWAIYFPKRDVGFDFVVSKTIGGSVLLRPVQVKGLYPTKEKKDKDTYGYQGTLTAVHPDMVLALPFFSAVHRGASPECIAYMPLSQIRPGSRGYRCIPAKLESGCPAPRKSFVGFFGEAGLASLEGIAWGKADF